MHRRAHVNAGLITAILLCTFESYFGWGWSIPGAAATVALTRPWLPSESSTLSAEPDNGQTQ